MQLTRYSDYSLRVLMYLGLNAGRRCTIHEIAMAYGISENHLMKLIHQLGLMGYITTTRGKKGGLELARPPKMINLGQLIRETEGNFNLVECFDPATNTCPIAGPCVLAAVFDSALGAFFEALDRHTLEDLLKPADSLKRRLMALNPE